MFFRMRPALEQRLRHTIACRRGRKLAAGAQCSRHARQQDARTRAIHRCTVLARPARADACRRRAMTTTRPDGQWCADLEDRPCCVDTMANMLSRTTAARGHNDAYGRKRSPSDSRCGRGNEDAATLFGSQAETPVGHLARSMVPVRTSYR